MAMLPPVQVDALPDTIEGFQAWRARLATTPQGGAATMVLALLIRSRDEAVGQACLQAAASTRGL